VLLGPRPDRGAAIGRPTADFGPFGRMPHDVLRPSRPVHRT
jgi:hypothetical protein